MKNPFEKSDTSCWVEVITILVSCCDQMEPVDCVCISYPLKCHRPIISLNCRPHLLEIFGNTSLMITFALSSLVLHSFIGVKRLKVFDETELFI